MPTYNPHTDSHAIQKYQFLHHFLPHPETQKRAKLLQPSALMVYVFIVVFFLFVLRFIPQVAPGVLGYASNISISDLLKETNKVRNENGLSSLRLNSTLTKAAESKAKHMFEYNYWAHVAPDGTTPWDFILGYDYDYAYAGENLAKNFSTSKDVVSAWVQSPSHKENLLSANYDEIGFAVVNGILDGYETTLVVQMFGRPRGAQQVATVNEEERILNSFKPEPVAVNTPVLVQEENYAVLPAVDVTTASRALTLTMGIFLVALLALDMWYTRRKAIPKISGNALAHILFLILSITGLWFVLAPGAIL